MPTKALMALAIAVAVTVPMSTLASARGGLFAVGGFHGGGFHGGPAGAGWRGGGWARRAWGWDDGWGPTYADWGNGCLVWRRGLDYFGERRLVQVDTCH
jgi:hypothetical protein